jgi:YD repeat-containing protein
MPVILDPDAYDVGLDPGMTNVAAASGQAGFVGLPISGGRWSRRQSARFAESYNAKNLVPGAATVMIDAKGDHLELRHDPQRNLQEIRTPQGHWIRFAYDDQSRLKRAEDDASNWAKYGYNSDGRLERATLSSGRQRQYGHDGDLMTRITD